MRTLLLLTLVFLLAPTVPAQKKPKTYQDRYAAYYAKHCATPNPRIEECRNDPTAHGCRKIMAHDLDCGIAKALAEPVHHPTVEEWIKAYEGLGADWELYDALETLHWIQFDYSTYHPVYRSTYYPQIYRRY